jgi:hypothetical protein
MCGQLGATDKVWLAPRKRGKFGGRVIGGPPRPERHARAMAVPPTLDVDRLKGERDRFVALAFCWADLLFELGADRKIVFAAGAADRILGRPATELMGTDFVDVIAPQDRNLIAQFMKIATHHGRMDCPAIRLAGRAGPTLPFAISGYRFDDFGNHFFIALRRAIAAAEDRLGEVLARDPVTGLLTPEAFTELATEKLRAMREAGTGARVTLLSLTGLSELHERLDAAA